MNKNKTRFRSARLHGRRRRKINKVIIIGVVLILFGLIFYFGFRGGKAINEPEGNGNTNFSNSSSEIQLNENSNQSSNLNSAAEEALNKNINESSGDKLVGGEVAIVIDDFGSGSPKNSPTKDFLSFFGPITFAVIPDLTYSKEVAKAAKAAGFEVLIHQPMEPLDPKINPGQGAILNSMDKTEVKAIINKSAAEIPEAVGLNNHMGSKVTQNEEIMKIVIETLKEKGLFFVDSLTIDKSVGAKVAKSLGATYGVRDIFLDDEDKVDSIKSQGEKLIELVRANPGQIPIAIGHNKKNTYAALIDLKARFESLGIKMVAVSGAVK